MVMWSCVIGVGGSSGWFLVLRLVLPGTLGGCVAVGVGGVGSARGG